MDSDLKKAFETIKKKQGKYSALFGYYDGNQPIVYSTAKLREIFRSIDVNFTVNMCSVVINAVKERIAFEGFNAKDQGIKKALDEMVLSQGLIGEADEVHEAALITGEAYIIVWPRIDADGTATNEVEEFYNDPRNAHVFYDPGNPKRASYGAKLWQDGNGMWHITLYYPDRMEYYVTTKKMGDSKLPAEVTSFMPDVSRRGVEIDGDVITWPVNEYGQIPIFHFQTERRQAKSDLVDVIPLQNAENKLLADMMVAAEYGAYKQRYVISNADTGGLKNEPNVVWTIPPGDGVGQATSVGEFSATDLENYIKGIDSLIGWTSSITNTPKHYFQSTTDAPSGEALIAMEAPLNKKVQDRIDKFSPVWQQVAAFALKVMGREVVATDIAVNFKKPETVQPKTEIEIITAESKLYPLDMVLKRHNYPQAFIDEVMKRVAEDEAKKTASLADVYSQAMTKFSRGGVK